MGYKEEYQRWLTSDWVTPETKAELKGIEGNDAEIEDRFYQELEFGTAGIRGVMGAGTNRMNQYTVGKATQGLANYILEQGTQDKGVAISYDPRNFSKEFAEESACVLAANGIKAYVFEELRPVPELSFAVRTLGATAGIMITASHNPPKYNGYKVYWDDGAQIVAPRDKEIIAQAKAVGDYDQIKRISKQKAIEKGLFETIGKEIDDQYIDILKKSVLNPEVIKQQGKDLKIVYTPLHGTGNTLVKRVLKELGFENVYIVPEQEKPDGNFPTVEKPNPEEKKSFALALELAKEKDADIVLATDPDADRLGIFAKDTKTGEYMEYSGNMSALLIAEYEISQKKEKGMLPKNGMLIKTIVSSNLADAIAKYYDLELVEVLTGFKYIGEKIKQEEEKINGKEYVFGFEESYGCLIAPYARDKDAIAAVMALSEAAAYYASKGLTLWDQMQNIYKKYGHYKEVTKSIMKEGVKGAAQIKEMMEQMRNHPEQQIGDCKVLTFIDYQKGISKNMETGETTKTELPTSNVLYYELEGNNWCCVRPSGTEPKIKFYIGAVTENEKETDLKIDKLQNWVRSIEEKSKPEEIEK